MTFQARPRKRFGQHWLRSAAILDKIVAAAQLTASDRVLEIGPGTGLLTQRLLTQAAAVVAVEIDRDLCQQLQQRFADVPHFWLLPGDILTLDLEAALAKQLDLLPPNKVVANIPYYITGPILEKLLGTLEQPRPTPFDTLVLLVQREVAARLCAQPGSKTFGALSVRVQYLADCEWICAVPPGAFQPPPKVESAVVRLMPRPWQQPPAQDPHLLQQAVSLGFANKRKMLRNNLTALIERDRLLPLLAQLGIRAEARAEDLSVAHWVALSNQIRQETVP